MLYYVHKGGGYIYVLILIFLSILLSYNIISFYFIHKKSKHISRKSIKFKFYNNIISNYYNKISQRLINLGNPYGISTKKYFSIKIISFIVLFIVYFRNHNIFIAIVSFIILFLSPDILISLYKKAESAKIINDISNIVQSLILSLSCNMVLYNALKVSIESIKYKRFKEEYIRFVDNYIMYNYNIKKAIQIFQDKFDSYEFRMFISILMQGEKEGKLLESIESFNESLDALYFKYIKYKSSQKMILVSVATIISLINSFVIVLYPIVIQISQNLSDIFK